MTDLQDIERRIRETDAKLEKLRTMLVELGDWTQQHHGTVWKKLQEIDQKVSYLYAHEARGARRRS